MRYALLPLTIILFVLEWVVGIVVALSAILFAEVIALFVDEKGDLPFPLRQLYQPADNKCWGDASWKEEHPSYSNFGLASSYLRRNAAYGYRYFCRLPVGTPTIFGNTGIKDCVDGVAGWYFAINQYGIFEFCWIKDMGNGKCWRGEYGWSLANYSEVLKGQLNLVFIVRQFDFTKKV